MLRLKSHITIGSYDFDYVMETSVSSTYDQFCDTAKITIPSKFRDVNKSIVNNQGVFKRGDAVTIRVGYHPYLNTVFQGFISKIIPDSPIRIECEDAGWKLKQKNITNFFKKNCTLRELITHLLDGTGVEFKCIDANIGTFRISNKDYVNILDCLDEVKQNFGLCTWFRSGVLYVGYPNTQQFYTTNELELSFQRDIVSSNLEYMLTGQVDVVLQGVSNKLDNTKITRYCFYDAEGKIVLSDNAGLGEQRSYNYVELSKSDLDAKLTEQLPLMIYDGYKGNFVTFGQPVIFPLDKITLQDLKFPEREGSYMVKKVDTSFGQGGYRQTIELDLKL